MMKNMVRQWIVGIFYPYKCPFCRKVIEGGHPGICTQCQRKIKKISQPCCKKCGRPVKLWEQEFCPDCTEKGHFYDEGMALYLYEQEVRKAVHRMKFQNHRVYGEVFGEAMACEMRRRIENWGVEAVIPVPMYKKKQRKRGYNQAELLAKKISEVLDL